MISVCIRILQFFFHNILLGNRKTFTWAVAFLAEACCGLLCSSPEISGLSMTEVSGSVTVRLFSFQEYSGLSHSVLRKQLGDRPSCMSISSTYGSSSYQSISSNNWFSHYSHFPCCTRSVIMNDDYIVHCFLMPCDTLLVMSGGTHDATSHVCLFQTRTINAYSLLTWTQDYIHAYHTS